MKKLITIALLLFAMLLSSCDNTGEGAETSGTTGVTTAETTAEITTDAETEEITAETTVDTTIEATEDTTAVSDTGTAPKFDINAEENLPYRLLNMTFKEIEAEYGPMEFNYLFAGGDPVYTASRISGISLMFPGEGDLDEQKTCTVVVEDASFVISPGVHVGMEESEVTDVLSQLDPRDGTVSYSEMGLYSTYYYVEEYTVQLTWNFPEETAIELMMNMENGASAKEYWKDHEFNGRVSGIIISKN